MGPHGYSVTRWGWGMTAPRGTCCRHGRSRGTGDGTGDGDGDGDGDRQSRSFSRTVNPVRFLNRFRYNMKKRHKLSYRKILVSL
ncbi:unnamed protein product [Coccothraustes coccothraustes]